MPNNQLTITITGLPELMNRIAGLPADILEEVDGEILDTVMVINGRQRRLAPTDQGGLRRGIGYEKKKTSTGMMYELFSNSEHSGYNEFGTKRKVDHAYIAKYGLTAIAQSMMGAGIRTGLTAREAIYAWCKRNAIPPQLWNIIYRSIMVNGIRARHYFFEPFFEEKDKLIQRIETILNEHNL